VGTRPKLTLALACASGMAMLETENWGEELWVPQSTIAKQEEEMFLEHTVIVQSASGSVLSKERLVSAVGLRQGSQEGRQSSTDRVLYILVDLNRCSEQYTGDEVTTETVLNS
jgi:hypothetical protein